MAPQLLSIWHTVKRGSRYRTKMKKNMCVRVSPDCFAFLNDCFCMFLFVLQKNMSPLLADADGENISISPRNAAYMAYAKTPLIGHQAREEVPKKNKVRRCRERRCLMSLFYFCQGKDLTFFTTCVRFYVSSLLLLRLLLHHLLASTATTWVQCSLTSTATIWNIFTDIKPTK